jgi:membrane-bound ClpP family serine protease
MGSLTAIIVLVVSVAGAAAMVAAVSRHKKSGTVDVELIGAIGLVDTTLDPEGTVFVRGELWRASSSDGNVVLPPSKVRVVGARDHLLLVHPTD